MVLNAYYIIVLRLFPFKSLLTVIITMNNDEIIQALQGHQMFFLNLMMIVMTLIWKLLLS